MTSSTKVYVLLRGLYEERYIQGIYATPELAIAAYPKGHWKEDTFDGRPEWTNDLDWDDAAEIREMDIVSD